MEGRHTADVKPELVPGAREFRGGSELSARLGRLHRRRSARTCRGRGHAARERNEADSCREVGMAFRGGSAQVARPAGSYCHSLTFRSYHLPRFELTASYRAQGKKLGGFAGQLARGEPTGNGRFNHTRSGLGRRGLTRPVTKCCRFAVHPRTYTPGA